MDCASFLQQFATELEFDDLSSLQKAPEILRESSYQLFESQAKLMAQEELLNGVRYLLGITSKESLLQAVRHALECNKETIPMSRQEIIQKLVEINVDINDKDSTKYLYSKLMRNLKK